LYEKPTRNRNSEAQHSRPGLLLFRLETRSIEDTNKPRHTHTHAHTVFCPLLPFSHTSHSWLGPTHSTCSAAAVAALRFSESYRERDRVGINIWVMCQEGLDRKEQETKQDIVKNVTALRRHNAMHIETVSRLPLGCRSAPLRLPS
jgi:hypothetical protein